MKNSKFKKGMSLFLTVLMLLSCWVFVPGEHQHKASAKSATINLSALAAISNGGGARADSSKIVICSDGEAGNTTVGNAKFSLSSLPNTVTKATLYISTGNHAGNLANSSVKFYMIDPAKCQATSIGHAVNNIANIYGSNYNAQQGVTNAYNYYGISESQALGSTLYQNTPGSYNFDVTSAINQAKANGWSDFCLAFIMPAIYNDGNGNTWSDLHINTSGTYLVCEYEGAYGMPSGTNQDGTITFNREGTTTVKYPTKMYMDISEDLADTGYSFKFTSNTNARVIFFPVLWGGQESDKNGNFENDRSNYDANLKGQNTIINAFDKYGLQLTGAGSYDNWTLDNEYTCVILIGNGNSNISGGANYTLQGKPKNTGTYSYSVPDYYNSNGGDPLLFVSNSGNTVYKSNSGYSGSVNFTITIYSKEALNQLYQKAVQIFNLNAENGGLIKEGLAEFDNRYGYSKDGTALTILRKRETTQNDIDNQYTYLENAIKGMKAYASNDALKTAIATADAYLNEIGYSQKYTQATRAALEQAYNNAKSSGYHSTVPVYSVSNLNDSSTWDFTSKAVADQATIDTLTNALNTAINAMEIQKYSITFNFANNTSNTQTYNYGAAITAPSNSTKEPDATSHYKYTWSPSVSTTVTNNATYSEVLTTEEHKWGNWNVVLAADCKTEGLERRTCSVCSYVEERNTGKDSSVHNNTTTVAQTNATCTTDGYTEGEWCYSCETWISGHQIIPAAHTPGAEATCTAAQTCTVCGEELAAQLAHTEAAKEENRVEPTCGKEGSYVLVTYCSVCNTEINREDKSIPATGKHTETTKEENRVEPTCGKEGSYILVTYCSVCNTEINRENKTISATGNHTWNDGEETKAPTCITEGVMTYTCNVCGETKTEAISATGNHVYGKWSQFNNGTTHRRYCEADPNCSAYEEGTHEFTSTTIRQLEGSNYHQYKCNKCDEAYGVGTVMNVGEACFGDGTTFAPIADNDNEHSETCKCGREKTDSHSYGNWFADPENSTDENGKMSRICSECSYKQTSSCTYSVAETKDPTCTEDGYKIWKCKDANCVNTYREVLDAKGHSPAEAVVENEEPATCYKEGSYDEVIYCSICDTVLSRTPHTIEKTAHSPAEAVSENVVNATCYKEGSYDEVIYCSVEECHFEISRTKKALEKITHSPAEAVRENVVDATCSKEGSYDEVIYCSVEECHFEISRTEKTLEKLPHTEEILPAEEATCTETGLTEGKQCSVCGEILVKQEVTPKKDHTYKAEITDPTCTEDGFTTYTCSACGDSYVSDEVAALGHTWSDWEEVTKATCLSEGEEKRVCSVCNETETQAISKLSHSYTGDYKWNNGSETKTHSQLCVNGCNEYGNETECTFTEVVTEPDCYKGGYTTYTCEVCKGSYQSDNTPKREHDLEYSKGNGTQHVVTCKYEDCAYEVTENCSGGEATCTNEAICENCKTAWGEVNPNNHTTEDTYVDGYVAPTCTTPGKTGDTKYKCCNAVKVASVEIDIDKNAHTGTATVIKNEKEATCTEEGYTGDTHWSCCDALEKEGSTIPMKAHTEEIVPGKEATCTETGLTDGKKCSVCGNTLVKQEEIEMIPHKDDNHDHICDYNCGTSQGECVDNNKDHKCDYGCDKVIGEHEDTDKNHICDYGCSDLIGECEDTDKDHACDYGCDKYFGEHEDSATDNDHVCDYGCGETLEDCVDGEDNNHNCDICNKEDISEHVWVDADCVTPKTCSVCNETEGTALGHSEGEVVVENNVKPDCENTGSYDNVVYCTVCKIELSRETIIVDALGHKDGETVVENNVDPDCENTGSYDEVIYCTVCDKELDRKTIIVDALGHTEVTDKAVAPTCTDTGLTEGKHCSVCGKVLVAQTVVNALGHNYEEKVTTEPTCTEKGVKTFTCKNDPSHTYTEDIAPLGHNEISHEAKAPTCTEIGWDAYVTCSRCDYTTYVEKAALGHDYEAVVTNPTCTEEGYTTYTCSVCGDSYVADKVDALGHKEGETVVENNVDPDCENTGSYDEVVYCTVCDKELYRKTITVDALGHKDGETVVENNVDPDCENTGSYDEVIYCTVCDKELDRKTITVDALGHTEVTDKAVAPTCTDTGLTEGKHCSVCGKVLVAQTVVNALGHNYEEKVTTEPTCTEKGVMTFTCKNDPSHTYTEDIDPLGHDEISHEAKAPTCTEIGWDAYVTCSRCDYSTYEEISPLGHKYDKVVTDPTCTEEGYTTYTCSVCDDTYVADKVAALGHKEGEVVVENNVDPDCENEGSYDNVVYCTVCKTQLSRETIIVDALGHTEVTDEAVAPTCTDTGLTEGKHCSVCDKVLIAQTVVNALGHNYEEKVTTEPTCTEKGVKTFTCKNDPSHTYTEDIAPLGHNEVEHEAKAPTCTEKGWDAYVTCSRCDYSTYEEISPLGHKYDKVVTNPTCTEEGYTTYTCSVCGDSYVADKVDALGHKEGETVVENNVKPDCENNGSYDNVVYCTVCKVQLSRETVIVPKLNHDYDMTKSEANLKRPELVDGEWTQGEYTYTCKNDPSHTTIEKVDRASYTAYETALSNLNSLLATDITDEAREAIRNAIADNKVNDNLIASEQSIIDTATANLIKAFEENNNSLNTYTVTFKIEGSDDVVVTVISGQAATAPTDVKKAYDDTYHYNFTGWDKAFDNITADTIVTAQFDSTEHSYTHAGKDDTYHTDSCSCGYSVDVKHSETSEVTTKASCYADGERTYTCSVCGSTRTEVIAKRTHDIIDTTVEKEATCTDTGIMNQKCNHTVESEEYEACAYTTTREIPVDKDAHKAEKDYTVIEKASCDTDGYKAILCEYCDEELTKETIARREHSYKDNGVATKATCLADGVMNIICTNEETATHKACSHESTKAIPMLSHSYTGEYQWNNYSDKPKTHSQKCVNGCNKYDNETECTFSEVVTPATCYVNGYTTYTCTVCNNHYDSDYTSREHIFVYAPGNGTSHIVTCQYENCDYKATKNCSGGEATCTDKAICENCNTAWGEVDPIAHTGTATVIKDKKTETCTEEGYTGDTYWSCCDTLEAKGTTIPMIPHIDENKDHVCDYGCDVPQGIHADSATDGDHVCDYGCGEVLEDCVDGDDNNHNCDICDKEDISEHIWVDADCVTPKTCSVCGLTEGNALGHSFTNYISDGNATCTADGTKTATCDNCTATDTITDEGSKLPHSFTNYVSDGNATCTADGTKTAKCDNCTATDTITDEGSMLDHSFTNYVSDGNATCTADGTKTAKCDNCTATDTITDEGSMLDHSFTNYISDGNATCTADGTKTAKCDNCTATDTIVDEGSMLGHSFTNYVSDGNATCTADGTKTAKCDNCDATDTIADEGSKLPHSFTNYVSDGNATCTADGTKTAKCDNCTATDTITDEGSMLDHSFTNYISDGNATCTADGTKTAKCDNCTATDTIVDEGSMLDHSFTNYVSDENATCTADGTKTAKCDNCTATDTITDEGSKLDHSYEADVTDPTCTEEGYTTYTCSACGDSYVADEVAALDHSFTNYVPDGNATCTEDGTKTAKCDRCDATDTITDEGSSSLQHNYIATEVEATCTEKGSVTYTCSICGDTYTDNEVPALGHSFTNYIHNNNATCIDKATKTATCDRCDATDTKVIEGSRLPHVPGAAVKENEIPATCRDKGSYERVYYCSGCGIKLSIEYVTVPTTNNHNMVVVPEKAATCDDNGHSEYIACTVCGYSRGKEIYPATGHIDENGDHICDDCDFDYTFNCVCICHSENKFIRFIYIVFRIFWKLFNVHRGCYCGIDHF